MANISGIIDKESLSNYQSDMKELLDGITKSQIEGTNIEFFESRLMILKQEVEEIENRRNDIKLEMKAVISQMQGKLITLDQMSKYLGKELGACEIKLKEAKGEI